MGTEIFQFQPGGAEKIPVENLNFTSIQGTNTKLVAFLAPTGALGVQILDLRLSVRLASKLCIQSS